MGLILELVDVSGDGIEPIDSNRVAYGIATVSSVGDDVRYLPPLADLDHFIHVGWLSIGHDFGTSGATIWWSDPIFMDFEHTFFTFGYLPGVGVIHHGATHLRYHLEPGAVISVNLYDE